jgi:hypothetical protein
MVLHQERLFLSAKYRKRGLDSYLSASVPAVLRFGVMVDVTESCFHLQGRKTIAERRILCGHSLAEKELFGIQKVDESIWKKGIAHLGHWQLYLCAQKYNLQQWLSRLAQGGLQRWSHVQIGSLYTPDVEHFL